MHYSLETLPEKCLEVIMDKLALNDFSNAMNSSKILYDIGQNVRNLRRIKLCNLFMQKGTGKWYLLHDGQKSKLELTPGSRFGATLVYFDNSLFLFGGATDNWTSYNDFWRFNLKEKHWSRRIIRSSSPNPRAAATGIVQNDNMFLLGGFELAFSIHAKRHAIWDNPVYKYNFTHNEWYPVQVDNLSLHQEFTELTGNSTESNCNHLTPYSVAPSFCLVNKNNIVIFGGAKSLLNHSQVYNRHSSPIRPYKLSNETYLFNLETFKVTRIDIAGNIKPPARCDHCAVSLGNNKMLVCGGYLGPNSRGICDLWQLDLNSSTWSEISVPGSIVGTETVSTMLPLQSTCIWQPATHLISHGVSVNDILVVLSGATLSAANATVAPVIADQYIKSKSLTNKMLVHAFSLSTSENSTCSGQWHVPKETAQDWDNSPWLRQGYSVAVGSDSIFVFGGIQYQTMYSRPVQLLIDLMLRDNDQLRVQGCSDLFEFRCKGAAIAL